MSEVPVEPFSNPFAPPEHEQADSRKANLNNDDFRRLLMTPRVSSTTSEATPAAAANNKELKQQVQRSAKKEDDGKEKKKSLYSKLKKEEEERQAEWDKKYRDRAKERRDDKNPDYSKSEEGLPSTSSYRAVAPGLVDVSVIAQERKKAIVESKFLGGDIQHTHLVKGLDYVLLDKVRGEMDKKEVDDITVLERKRERERAKAKAEVNDDLHFTTTLGKNVYRRLFLSRTPVRNELFSPGRMAYVFELDEEYSESDIPTVLIRSKADCPVQESTTLTTNDIVINKLTQILSYLRQGMRSGKRAKKRDRGIITDSSSSAVKTSSKLPGANQNIFDDVGEYAFGASTSIHHASNSKRPDTYFDATSSSSAAAEGPHSTVEIISKFSSTSRVDEDHFSSKSKFEVKDSDPNEKEENKKEGKGSAFGSGGLSSHYAECYPGGVEDFDGNYDSDEDADFTKMDMGNKKGPVKRWDFDNEEDYSQYQSKREALPKAAFQYGVKMSEGRKTRRYGNAGVVGGKAKEKAKLDREWQQISALLDKRKGGSDGGTSSAAKRSKY